MMDVYDYNPESGVFRWKKSTASRFVAGQEAGSIAKNGYRYLSFRWQGMPAHRVAWLFTHGEWPPEVVDHINNDKADNRLSNLRAVSHARNLHNLKKNDACGVRQQSENSFAARICFNGQEVVLGSFRTEPEARAAHAAAKARILAGGTP